MRRYSLDQSCLNLEETLIVIKQDNFHHICIVCRNIKGSKFEVLIKEKAYLVEIKEILKKEAIALILETRELVGLKKPFLHLVLSMPKFSVFESILAKSVEMGVSEIHLLSTANSFVKVASKISKAKYDRWDKIISASMGQSDRSEPLVVHPLASKELVVQRLEFRQILSIVAYINSVNSFSSVLKSIKPTAPEALAVFIGSEGGFTEGDMSFFNSQNMQDFSLGVQVLKVETACLFSISLVKYELQGI